MRTGVRVSPSWLGGALRSRIRCSRLIIGALEKSLADGAGHTFFKILDCALGLGVMAGASRKLAIAHLAQHAAECLLGDDDAEFLENPLPEIDDPPAHDPMNRRDRPALDERRERRAMRLIEPPLPPRRLALDQAVRPLRVEPHHPVANDLKRHPANLRRLGTARAVVNRRKGQKPSGLRPILRSFRRHPQRPCVIISPKTNRRRHGEPPLVRHGRIEIHLIRESPPRESASARTGIMDADRSQSLPCA